MTFKLKDFRVSNIVHEDDYVKLEFAYGDIVFEDENNEYIFDPAISNVIIVDTVTTEWVNKHVHFRFTHGGKVEHSSVNALFNQCPEFYMMVQDVVTEHTALSDVAVHDIDEGELNQLYKDLEAANYKHMIDITLDNKDKCMFSKLSSGEHYL